MPRPTNTPGQQRGISLISLMVGLLLAMIGILAGMTLYKSMVQTSIQTRNDALQDGQLASAMLTLQLELQSAGYGIPTGGAAAHVQRVNNTIYWRYIVNGATQCKGFQIQDLDNNTRRELQLLKIKDGTNPCNTTDALNAFQWETASVVAEFRASIAANADIPVITLELANGQCFPYGMSTAALHPIVTIIADNAAISAAKKAGGAAPNNPFRYDFCLSNL